MAGRSIAATAAIALAVALAGCSGDPKNVESEVNHKAISVGNSLIRAVRRGSWQRACSLLTLDAQIELEDWVQRRQGLRTRPSCERALSGEAFRELCRGLWKRSRPGSVIYREYDVGETDSKPTVAWAAVRRRRQLTSRCEMRLTRAKSDDVSWRIDAIAVERAQSVLARDRDKLVYQNKVSLAEHR